MEYPSVGVLDDKETTTGKNVAESVEMEAYVKDDPKQLTGSINTGDFKGGENISHEVQADLEASGEGNIEGSISSEDVIRAGGFGARDDISSFLPVASDSTDFEASLRDAREYEDPQGEICRPGLGWTEDTK